MKHRLRPQRSVSLLAGIMRIAMISKEQRDRQLHTLNRGVQVPR